VVCWVVWVCELADVAPVGTQLRSRALTKVRLLRLVKLLPPAVITTKSAVVPLIVIPLKNPEERLTRGIAIVPTLVHVSAVVS